MSATHRVAVVQAAPVPFRLEPTVGKATRLIREAGAGGATLALFPEAFIGGYPKGCGFKTPVGARLPGSRDMFLDYFAGATLALFPEAFIGGYPKGCGFKTPVGARLPGSRDMLLDYFAGATLALFPEAFIG